MLSRLTRRRLALQGLVLLVLNGGLLFWVSQTALAACPPKNSTIPPGSCPSPGPLAPIYAKSAQTSDILHLFLIILAESAVVFILIMGALFINIVRFSHKPGHDEEPRQVYGNRRIEVIWTVIPTIILFFAFVGTVVVLGQIDTPAKAAGALKVEAIGHQWWWEFRIPKYHVVTANELHIPANRLVEIDTTSVDVIHAFWVPQLSRQIDALPNNHTIVYIQTPHTGTYSGACYQFCGQGHAWMQFRMAVDKPANFVKWAKHQASSPASVKSETAAKGESLFFNLSCGACHTINGTPANGTAAPNLTHVGGRWAIGGGVLMMSKINLERWIHDPNHWKEGVLMPAFPLPHSQLRELATYLTGLK